MSDQNIPEKNVLDDVKLRLSEKVGENYASLMWGYYDNNPRITVFTGPKGEKPIQAKMDSPTFGTLMELLVEVANFKPTDDKKKISYAIDCNRPANKGQSGTVLESRIHVGKDEAGKVFLAVQQTGKEVVKFVFKLNTRFHGIRHASGEAVSDAEMSVWVARAYARDMMGYLHVLKTLKYVDTQAKHGNGGNGGGYNNNRGGNGGGYNNGGNSNGGSQAASSNSFTDDDITF